MYYFNEMDKAIQTSKPEKGKCATVTALKKKRREMLNVAKQLDRIDLKIIYYIRNLHRTTRCSLMYALMQLYTAQEEYENLIRGNQEEDTDET